MERGEIMGGGSETPAKRGRKSKAFARARVTWGELVEGGRLMEGVED